MKHNKDYKFDIRHSNTCVKCGKAFPSLSDMEFHVLTCNGASISMDVINTIAEGGSVDAIGFTCELCGKIQNINELHNWGKEIIFPICDNCKNDLKEIILTKRQKT